MLFLYRRASTSDAVLAPVFYLPTAISGRGTKSGVGINGDGDSYGFEHWEVRDRVRISVGAREIDVPPPGKRGEHTSTRLTRDRRTREFAGVNAVLLLQTSRKHVVGQIFERLQ